MAGMGDFKQQTTASALGQIIGVAVVSAATAFATKLIGAPTGWWIVTGLLVFGFGILLWPVIASRLLGLKKTPIENKEPSAAHARDNDLSRTLQSMAHYDNANLSGRIHLWNYHVSYNFKTEPMFIECRFHILNGCVFPVELGQVQGSSHVYVLGKPFILPPEILQFVGDTGQIEHGAMQIFGIKQYVTDQEAHELVGKGGTLNFQKVIIPIKMIAPETLPLVNSNATLQIPAVALPTMIYG